MFKDLTKKERAWILYDVGNSAFTMLACSLIPIFFKALAIGDAWARSAEHLPTTRTGKRSSSGALSPSA